MSEMNLEEETPVENSVEETVDQNEPENEQPEVFPRHHVEELRQENAKHRTRAKEAEERAAALAAELFYARVAATGRLADPSDLPFREEYLNDPVALEQAIEELLEAKPHLGKRSFAGNVGQGMSDVSDSVDLAGLLRSRA